MVSSRFCFAGRIARSGILPAMSFPYLKNLVHTVFGVDLPLPIPMFGLMVGIAFFVGLKVATLEVKRLLPAQPANLMDNAGLIAFFTGLLGARLFHLLEHPREFMADPMAMLLSRGGFTIFGGLIVGTISGLAYCRAKRAPLAPVLDAVAPAVMLSYAIGRIGCQISGDGDWGIAADLAAKPDWLPTWFWAQTYDGNIAGMQIPPPGVYPTPIYEILMSFIAFAVLWRLRKHSHAARLAVLPLSTARGPRAPGGGKYSRQHHLRSRRIHLHPGATHRNRLHHRGLLWDVVLAR